MRERDFGVFVIDWIRRLGVEVYVYAVEASGECSNARVSEYVCITVCRVGLKKSWRKRLHMCEDERIR